MSERVMLFKQYNDIKAEIESVKAEIHKREEALEQLNEDGLVKDKVYGGYGGVQGFVIEGFPEKEWKRRCNALRRSKAKLHERETDLIETLMEIEDSINEIKVSRDRLVMRKYFIEGQKQHEIAQAMYIERSLVSKIIAKYT